MDEFKALFSKLPPELRPSVVAALQLFVAFEKEYKRRPRKPRKDKPAE